MTEFQMVEELVKEVTSIKETKSPEYIKSVVEGDKVHGIDFLVKIVQVDLIREVEKFEPGYMKRVIEEEKVQLDSHARKMLLIEIGDIQYIKDILDSKNIKGLVQADIVDLLKFIGESKYIKDVLTHNKIINMDSIDLIDLVDLIKSTGDVDYIKSILEDNAIQRLGSLATVILLKEVEKFEPGYIRKYVIECNKIATLEFTDRIDLVEEMMGISYLTDIANGKIELPGMSLEERDILSAQLPQRLKNKIATKNIKDEIRNNSKIEGRTSLEISKEELKRIMYEAQKSSAIGQENAISILLNELEKDKNNEKDMSITK